MGFDTVSSYARELGLGELAGYEIPETMQGRSLVVGKEKKSSGGGSDEESARIVHDRLAGLGYV